MDYVSRCRVNTNIFETADVSFVYKLGLEGRRKEEYSTSQISSSSFYARFLKQTTLLHSYSIWIKNIFTRIIWCIMLKDHLYQIGSNEIWYEFETANAAWSPTSFILPTEKANTTPALRPLDSFCWIFPLLFVSSFPCRRGHKTTVFACLVVVFSCTTVLTLKFPNFCVQFCFLFIHVFNKEGRKEKKASKGKIKKKMTLEVKRQKKLNWIQVF